MSIFSEDNKVSQSFKEAYAEARKSKIDPAMAEEISISGSGAYDGENCGELARQYANEATRLGMLGDYKGAAEAHLKAAEFQHKLHDQLIRTVRTAQVAAAAEPVNPVREDFKGTHLLDNKKNKEPIHIGPAQSRVAQKYSALRTKAKDQGSK